MQRARAFSYLRGGKLIAGAVNGLRARSVRLKAGSCMDWHSTKNRQEILLVIGGKVIIETASSTGKLKQKPLSAGFGIFLPEATRHRVTNALRRVSSYVYVTGRK